MYSTIPILHCTRGASALFGACCTSPVLHSSLSHHFASAHPSCCCHNGRSSLEVFLYCCNRCPGAQDCAADQPVTDAWLCAPVGAFPCVCARQWYCCFAHHSPEQHHCTGLQFGAQLPPATHLICYSHGARGGQDRGAACAVCPVPSRCASPAGRGHPLLVSPTCTCNRAVIAGKSMICTHSHQVPESTMASYVLQHGHPHGHPHVAVLQGRGTTSTPG